MRAPEIDNSTADERRAFVLHAWRCLHNCELCGKCNILKGRDPETIYTDYIEGKRSYMEATLSLRETTYNK